MITTRERSAPPSRTRGKEPRRRSLRTYRRRTWKYEDDDEDDDDDDDDESSSEEDSDSDDSDDDRRARERTRSMPIALRRTKRPIKHVQRFADEIASMISPKHQTRALNRERSIGRGYLESSDSSDSDEYERQARQAEATLTPINSAYADQTRAIRADLTPLEIDTTIDWSSIGGLEQHVRALKEMVVFPLMYGDIYAKFQVQPPKVSLFRLRLSQVECLTSDIGCSLSRPSWNRQNTDGSCPGEYMQPIRKEGRLFYAQGC